MSNTIGLGEYQNEDLIEELKNRGVSVDINPIDPQQKVIDYCLNPENLKKAAEGSMEKRQAAFDKWNESDYIMRLPKDVLDIIGKHSTLWKDDKYSTIFNLYDLFTHQLELAKIEAKIDEIKNHDKNLEYGHWAERANMKDRIRDLTKQKELLNE